MKVSELLTGPEKWTQGAAARDVSGGRVDPIDLTAFRWCILGAIVHCYAEWKPIEDRLIGKLFGGRKRKLGDCLSVWNDSHTFPEVRQLIEELGI